MYADFVLVNPVYVMTRSPAMCEATLPSRLLVKQVLGNLNVSHFLFAVTAAGFRYLYLVILMATWNYGE